MFGNISSKRSRVNQLEMPSPGVKSHEGPTAVQTPPPVVGDKVGNGVERPAVMGVGVAGVEAGTPSAHWQRSLLQTPSK